MHGHRTFKGNKNMPAGLLTQDWPNLEPGNGSMGKGGFTVACFIHYVFPFRWLHVQLACCEGTRLRCPSTQAPNKAASTCPSHPPGAQTFLWRFKAKAWCRSSVKAGHTHGKVAFCWTSSPVQIVAGSSPGPKERKSFTSEHLYSRQTPKASMPSCIRGASRHRQPKEAKAELMRMRWSSDSPDKHFKSQLPQEGP